MLRTGITILEKTFSIEHLLADYKSTLKKVSINSLPHQSSVALPSERFSNVLRKKLLLKKNVNEGIRNTDLIDHMPLKIPLVLLVGSSLF